MATTSKQEPGNTMSNINSMSVSGPCACVWCMRVCFRERERERKQIREGERETNLIK